MSGDTRSAGKAHVLRCSFTRGGERPSLLLVSCSWQEGRARQTRPSPPQQQATADEIEEEGARGEGELEAEVAARGEEIRGGIKDTAAALSSPLARIRVREGRGGQRREDEEEEEAVRSDRCAAEWKNSTQGHHVTERASCKVDSQSDDVIRYSASGMEENQCLKYTTRAVMSSTT
eukprot:753954-Hanusia_phi.AAC.4